MSYSHGGEIFQAPKVSVDDHEDDVNIILGLHVKNGGGNREENTSKQKNKQKGFGCFGEDSSRSSFHESVGTWPLGSDRLFG